MYVQVFDNVSRTFLSGLLHAFRGVEDVRIAVAFASGEGVRLVEAALADCLERGGRVELLLGLDPQATEPEALRLLHEMSKHHDRLSCYCIARITQGPLYHPKLYLMRRAPELTACVGSSNLTAGGLKRNPEVNVLICAGLQEEFASDIYAAYNSLKFIPSRVQPDEEFVSLYADVVRELKRGAREALGSNQLHRLTADFRAKVASLRRRLPQATDLFGWQSLVYNAVPEGPFTNRDVYELEERFRLHYPDNKNIRAKVRQQLQQLRDIGLLQHMARGEWMKVAPDEGQRDQTRNPD